MIFALTNPLSLFAVFIATYNLLTRQL